MATYTPNLNLKKPSTGELYDVVADLNDAKDKIDKAVGKYTEIEPESLRLNALESDGVLVQRAIDLCLVDRPNHNIKLGRIYNITQTLKINNEGIHIAFVGTNGGFCNKQNAPMFSSDYVIYNGMVDFLNVKFVGDLNYLTSPLFDCGEGTRLIQLIFANCSFYEAPTVVYSSQFLQSIRFLHCTFKVQKDYIVKALIGYDILFDGNTVETGPGGVISLTTTDMNQYSCYGVRIINNCIEAITTRKPILLTQALNLDISNNYFEGNAYTDIDLSGAVKQHKGLKITGNFFGNYTETYKDSCVKTGLLYSNQGYDFSANSGVKMIFDFTGSGGRYINMSGGISLLSGQPSYKGIESDEVLFGKSNSTKELIPSGNTFELPIVNANAGDYIKDFNEYITMSFARTGSALYAMRYTGYLYFISGYNSTLGRTEIRVRFKPIMALSQNNFTEEIPSTTMVVTFKSTGTDRLPLSSMGESLNDSIVFRCTDASVNGCFYGKHVRIE